jgi:hypothetical protein
VIGSLRAWQRSNPATLAKVFPAGLIHPSQWPGYARNQPEFSNIFEFFKEFDDQLDKYGQSAKDTHQFMRNLGHYFLDKDATLQCPLCAKWVLASKKCRHGEKCFLTTKVAG